MDLRLQLPVVVLWVMLRGHGPDLARPRSLASGCRSVGRSIVLSGWVRVAAIAHENPASIHVIVVDAQIKLEHVLHWLLSAHIRVTTRENFSGASLLLLKRVARHRTCESGRRLWI